MSREVEFCHRDRLIELGLTMTWEEREGEQDVRMRRSAVQAQQKQPSQSPSRRACLTADPL